MSNLDPTLVGGVPVRGPTTGPGAVAGLAPLSDGSGGTTWAAAGVSAHGDLTGLGDDDHTIYALADKSRPSTWVAAGDLSGRSLADLGTRAHSDLTGMTTGDPHTQYALLAGRAGGQTVNLGLNSGDNGRVDSTAHATKGILYLNGTLAYVDANGTFVSAKSGGAVITRNIQGASASWIELINFGNTTYFGIESSTGGSVITGTGAYSTVAGNNSARSLHLATNGLVRQTIDSSGGFTFLCGAAGTIAGIFKGAASRTAPLFQLQTSAGGIIANVGGTIAQKLTDTNTSSTDGTEDNLASFTLIANCLAVDGDSIEQWEHISAAVGAAKNQRIRRYFAGNELWDSGALSLSLGADFFIVTKIVRLSATTAQATVSVATTSASSVPYVKPTALSGLTLTGTNILKTTAAASGAGAAAADISEKPTKVYCFPAQPT